MSSTDDSWSHRVSRVVDATSYSDLRDGYDAWAEQYDADHCNYGQLLLAHFTAMFCRHIPKGAGPILDAGAGTGRVGETLSLHGYGDFVGIDLSPGMLEVAGTKPGYRVTRVMKLGETLDFADDTFSATVSLAAFSPNHCRSDAFDELIRVTRPGGILLLSMRAGFEEITGFKRRGRELESQKMWQLLDETGEFVSHPELDPPMQYSISVYRKASH